MGAARARRGWRGQADETARFRLGRLLQRWSLLLGTRLPRGAGVTATAAIILASVAYGTVKGDHVPTVITALKDARDAVANAAGFRIVSIALAGNHHVSREEVLAIAGVTGSTSLLFLDVEQTRERLKTNPWIADATVLKLYPGELQIGIKERLAFALWQKDGRVSVIADDGTVLEPFVAPSLIRLPLVVGRGAETRAKEFLALLARYPQMRDFVRAVGPGRRAALEPAAQERHRRAAAGIRYRRRTGAPGRARPREESDLARHRRDRSAAAGPRHGAAVGRRRAGARRHAQGQEAEEKGRCRMNALASGLTPKMKPLAPRRSALVGALDVGTSKIACLIARLKPRPSAGRRCARRTHAIEVLGFGHTLARGMKSGAVIDLAEAEAAVRQAVDVAERAAKVQLESVVVSVSAGRPRAN